MHISASDIDVRGFEERRDLPQVIELLRAALGETAVLRRTPELFSWKHRDNPFGRSMLFVATHGDRVVGLRAFMRWDLTTPSGDMIRCVRPVDTATHPDFQRLGIFQRLTERAIEAARSDGIDLIFNTPNAQSGAGYVKMGWSIAGAFGVLVRPSWRAAHRRFQSEVAVPTASSTEVVATRSTRGFQTLRSKELLEWRLAHPTARYGLAADGDGYVLFRQGERAGRTETVVSLIGGRPARALGDVLCRSRSAYAAAWFPPGSPERRTLVQHGFIPIPGVKSLMLACMPLRQLPLDPMSLSNWDVGLVDLELL